MPQGRNGRRKVENTDRKYWWDLIEIVVKRWGSDCGGYKS